MRAITSAMTFEIDSLAARGSSHTQLRELLDARATIVHPGERDALLDAADALLFDEPDAGAKRDDAATLLDALVDSGRWLPEPAAAVRAALDGCGRGALTGATS